MDHNPKATEGKGGPTVPLDVTGFWKMPTSLNHPSVGAWARLVFCALLNSCRVGAGYGSFTTSRGMRSLASELGTSRNTVERAIRDLEVIGLLSVRPAARGGISTYTLSVHDAGTVKEQNRPRSGDSALTISVPGSGAPASPDRTKGVHDRWTEPATNRGHILEENREQQRAAAVFASLGIEAPTNQRLAEQFPAATPALVAEALTGLRADSLIGLKVNTIRDRLPAIISANEAREPVRRELEAVLSQAREQYAQRRDEVDRALRRLDDDGTMRCGFIWLVGRLVACGASEVDARGVVKAWRDSTRVENRTPWRNDSQAAEDPAWLWARFAGSCPNDAAAAARAVA